MRRVAKKKETQVQFFYDRWLLSISLVLVLLGLLMVSSASMVTSDRIFHTPFYYCFRQAFYVMSGICIAWMMTRIPMVFWERIGHLLFIGSIFVLLIVLVPGIGKVVNGSRRWLHFGFISLQVSEIVKLTAILYLAGYLTRHLEEVRTRLSGFMKPMLFLGLICGLLLLEPDFGTASVMVLTFLVLLFIAGARLLPFLGMMVGVLSFMFILAISSPYRLQRLTTFLDPWLHAYSSGYQLTQSLIAFGRGGIFGVGLGNSVQKLFYLPEAHTDFIFAVIAEELGLIGELLLIALFVFFIVRVIQLAQNALKQGQHFLGFTAWGIGLWIAFQAFINMGVNIGILPTKGLTLPLISYGGSSMWATCAAIGVLLRIAFEMQLHEYHADRPRARQ